MNEVRSRRSVLGAALGGAAVMAAAGLAKPLVTDAASGSLMTEVDNPTTAQTSVSNSVAGDVSLAGVSPTGVGLKGVNVGPGAGVLGTSDESIAVAGFAGDVSSGYPDLTQVNGTAGLYGYGVAPATDPSMLGMGVAAFGDGFGVGGVGAVGVAGFGATYLSGNFGTGVYGFSGAGIVGAPENVGVFAAASGTAIALQVQGPAKFSRSGRASIAKKKSSKAVSVPGMTSSNLVLAVLQAHRTGVYVVAAVPAAGKFTVYLNKAVTTATNFAWIVLN